MTTTTIAMSLSHDVIIAAAQRAARAIPPLWPLASSVAVNPFLGQASEPLEVAAARLRRASGIAVTMPRSWYAERLQSGEITEDDLQAAFQTAPAARARRTCPRSSTPSKSHALRRRRSRRWPNWPATSRRSTGPASSTSASVTGPPATSIKARHCGCRPIRRCLQHMADHRDPRSDTRNRRPRRFFTVCVGCTRHCRRRARRLRRPPRSFPGRAGRLFPPLADHARRMGSGRPLSALAGGVERRHRCMRHRSARHPHALGAALLHNGGSALVPGWQSAIAAYAAPVAASSDDVVDSILQEAAERAAQRKLNTVLAAPSSARLSRGRLTLQMAFCIDVRSEVFRRALESLDSGITTLGFAGFFGFGIGHRRFASDVVEARLPVLLSRVWSPAQGSRRQLRTRPSSARGSPPVPSAPGPLQAGGHFLLRLRRSHRPDLHCQAAARWARAGPPPRTDRSRAAPGP